MSKEKRPKLNWDNSKSPRNANNGWSNSIPNKTTDYGSVFAVSEPLLLPVYMLLNDAATKSLRAWKDNTVAGREARAALSQTSERIVQTIQNITLAAQTKQPRPALYVKTASNQRGGTNVHNIHPIGSFGHARELTGHIREFCFPLLPAADATNAWMVGLPMTTQSGTAPNNPYTIGGHQVQVSSTVAGHIRQRSLGLYEVFSRLCTTNGLADFICLFEEELRTSFNDYVQSAHY
ncbi:hypothetical protein BDZ89DRAFT_1069608 [Hymenopellis radicata]|nr:hypothetical protein BDZ89DRAFT_1069608 [Hymenopellis radicata]